jgi:sigma-B regulation protein RsbU (phosphoserine phosphatase)
MDTPLPNVGSGLEITFPDGSRQFICITESPFLIGRGLETGNHLQLVDRRISRQCAAIISEGGQSYLENRGHRYGIFVNGTKIDRCALHDGDAIHFGFDDSPEIIFRANADDISIQNMLDRIGNLSTSTTVPGGLRKLNLLLEATSLLHSQLPLDSVLANMLDHAIAITEADRALLLETDSSEALSVRLARGTGGVRLSPENLTPSQAALRLALRQQSNVIAEDINLSDFNLQSAESIVAQQLRAIVVIPLYSMPRANSATSVVLRPGLFLGVLYLDSRRPAAFSNIDRQILDALGMEAASILDNARLVDQERQRLRLEQELNIARNIQQALLPGGFRDSPYLTVSGMNSPCLAVGGDYFDVFPVTEDRTAFLIADVSGKGLGAALLTTMLQGALTAMTIGIDPARIFHLINRFLCEHAEVGHYATLFFGILSSNGELEYINAGHPLPLLLRGGKVTEPFVEGAVPVGLIYETKYVTSKAQLQPDDTLLLFSDGVTEAMNSEDHMFGVPRLCEVLGALKDAPLDLIQRAVLDSVQKFTHGVSQRDDITLLLLRYREPAQSPAS